MPNRSARLIAAACALVALGAAHAEPNPFYLRASETVTYDSNLFRVPDALGKSHDTISSTEVAVGIDQPYGRQRWLANAGLNYNAFSNNDDLNHTGYDLLLGLDWQALSRWSGDVRLTSTRQQASFENYGALSSVNRNKNLERIDNASLRAQYGLAALWVLEGRLEHRDVNFSDSSFADREYRHDQAGVAAYYQPSDLLRLGVAARHTKGTYPHATSTSEDDYKRNDIDLTVRYKYSGLSTFDARLTATDESHDLIDRRDFNGVTGTLGWNYAVTGKTSLDLRYTRDTGTFGNGVPVQIDPTVNATYLTDARLSDRVSVGVRWEPTAKITVRGEAGYSRDSYDQQFLTLAGGGSVPGVSGDSGHSRNFKVGVAYQATRAWSLGCDVGRRSRSTPVTVRNVGYDYDADVANCSVQLMLQ